MSASEYIDLVKEKLAATFVLDLTGDEYMKTIDEIYGNNVYKGLEIVGEEIKNMRAQSDEAFFEQIKSFQSFLDKTLSNQLDSYENYIAKSIFRIPNFVPIDQDSKVEKDMLTYSEEEDKKLEKEIEDIKMRINQKRLYFKLLRDQASLVACVKQASSKLIKTKF